MMFFFNRRPRGYHHKYIYVDERKEILDEIEKRARRELQNPDKKLEEQSNVITHDAYNPDKSRYVSGNTFILGISLLVFILILGVVVWLCFI